MTRCIFVFS